MRLAPSLVQVAESLPVPWTINVGAQFVTEMKERQMCTWATYPRSKREVQLAQFAAYVASRDVCVS